MARDLSVLCFHGLGDHRTSDWQREWSEAIQLPFRGSTTTPLLSFASYDPIFEKTDLSFAETSVALAKLASSGLTSFFRRDRGLVADVSQRVRWTAGYVVAFLEDEQFQRESRAFVLDKIRDVRPDVVLAHSLGSLVTYNAFAHADAREGKVAKALSRTQYVTFGSQIGNPFVVGNLTYGRVKPMPVAMWTHLYNRNDDVFTAPLSMPGVDNFRQLLTPFDLPGYGDHAAPGYLGHRETVASLWMPLADGDQRARELSQSHRATPGKKARRPSTAGRQTEPVRRRALLVGINDYPNEKDRLEGCVNDVFTMSAVLQECGFAPGDVRTCLDRRATAAGILERMRWLCSDARPKDELVFYFSGHGARVPEYGAFMEPDRLTETLVPWDFDWSPETSISDEQICDIYSQLPYDTRLLMVFDCCHSGGMHRQGGAKARGITPPDDIRHRELKWDIDTQMWVARDFQRLDRDFAPKAGERSAFFGRNGSTVRLGRSAALRLSSRRSYEAEKKREEGPVGPFLPLIIEACGEEQLSFEYRHGATSYGAFTFCLASLLRQERDIDFERLVQLTRDRLATLGYDQVPQILGPSAVVGSKVPFGTGQLGSGGLQANVPGIATPRASG